MGRLCDEEPLKSEPVELSTPGPLYGLSVRCRPVFSIRLFI